MYFITFACDIYFCICFLGGRFATFHNPHQPECRVDLGAQFVSATLDVIRSHARLYLFFKVYFLFFACLILIKFLSLCISLDVTQLSYTKYRFFSCCKIFNFFMYTSQLSTFKFSMTVIRELPKILVVILIKAVLLESSCFKTLSTISVQVASITSDVI